MLKRLGPSVVRAGEADASALFRPRLEFNPPAHGPWNIVHIGMLVPEAHQIYVCAINCMRGVVLTAAEMGAQDRFSCVVLREEDITRGTVEEVTVRGVADVLHKLEAHASLPPCVMVFPVCTHHFLGVNMGRVYRKLQKEFPGVDFVRAWMDPIMKRRRSPDQWLRRVMYDPLRPCKTDGHLVVHLGSDFPLDGDCELRSVLRDGGYRVRELQDCTTYAEYLGLARAATIVGTYPAAQYGLGKLSERLGCRYLYLPACFGYDEIRAAYGSLHDALGVGEPDYAYEIGCCEEALGKLSTLLGDTPIAIDAAAHPRPLGLARLLLEHGMRVAEVYLDGVSGEESADFAWLHMHAPEVEFSSIVLPELRIASRERGREMLAIGQKAAWFCGTTRFVNIVEGRGLWGFAGIRNLVALAIDAWEYPKDPADLIPRKGLGCPSCI